MAKKSQFKESFLLIPAKPGMGSESGTSAILLEGQEYPYLNIQVIPTNPQNRSAIHEALKRTHGFVIEAPGREDFCVVQAGGGKSVEINQSNFNEVVIAIRKNLEEAAAYWAEKHPVKH